MGAVVLAGVVLVETVEHCALTSMLRASLRLKLRGSVSYRVVWRITIRIRTNIRRKRVCKAGVAVVQAGVVMVEPVEYCTLTQLLRASLRVTIRANAV